MTARAYQLLYRTTDATGQPIATVTTLLVPITPAPGAPKLVSDQSAGGQPDHRLCTVLCADQCHAGQPAH